MSSVIAVKLFAGPLVIGLASLAGKRWGPAAAGLLGGLPLIAACVIAALWLEHGQDYALAAASAAPAGLWANIVYMLALGFASRRFGWPGMLACGWLIYLCTAVALAFGGLAHSLPLGVTALAGLLIAVGWLLPRIVPLPKIEIATRMAAAFALVVSLTALTLPLGPALTGVLSAGPVAATVIPAFTLANAGRDAVLVQLRGFLTGLVGTGASLLCLAPLAAHLGGWAALPAAAIALGAGYGANLLMQRLQR
ncbi:hypothetical protein R0381_002039 [Jeongeupia wiesaeckerbachi]|uniref:hypothetical protein n=1 Tax=Jeongeupia wiesaeckerbachi TaxID=3051218 RepID=UPI003D804FB7